MASDSSLISSDSCKRNQCPFIFKNKLKHWKLISFTKEKWCSLFHEKMLCFRKGTKCFKESPAWERTSEEVSFTLKDFFDSNHKDSWFYYDYKYLKDIFPNGETLQKEIKWGDLGLNDVSVDESTLWIGSEGAHTPCHQDTYGFNVVVQLFGRKLWLLVPPQDSKHMKPTRVPYEESSVYSRLNFYSPNYSLLDIPRIYKVILEPGDVLVVPRHWWHYVENLECAISINTWVPMEEDHEARLEEILVQKLVTNFCQDLTLEEAESIVNPNNRYILKEPPTDTLLRTIIEKCQDHRNKSNSFTCLQHLASNNCEYLEVIVPEKLREFIDDKARLLGYSPGITRYNECDLSPNLRLVEILINSFALPETICIAKENLLHLYEERKS